jgi:hypothetical protein
VPEHAFRTSAQLSKTRHDIIEPRTCLLSGHVMLSGTMNSCLPSPKPDPPAPPTMSAEEEVFSIPIPTTRKSAIRRTDAHIDSNNFVQTGPGILRLPFEKHPYPAAWPPVLQLMHDVYICNYVRDLNLSFPIRWPFESIRELHRPVLPSTPCVARDDGSLHSLHCYVALEASTA